MLRPPKSRRAACGAAALVAIACGSCTEASDGNRAVLSVVVPAIVSVAIAVLNWFVVSRQQRRELDTQDRQLEAQRAELLQKSEQHRQEMALAFEEFRQKYITPQDRLLQRLDTLGASAMVHGDRHPVSSITPYTVGLPISDPAGVYGRVDLARALLQRAVGGRSSACISVLGSRRAGKTTLLYYIRQPEVLRAHLSNWHALVTVYVDLQAHYETPNQFYGGLLRATVRALETQGGLQLDSPTLPFEVDYSYVLDFFSRIRHPARRLLILLDELETLAAAEAFDDGFFGRLRALTQAEGSNMALVTTSFRSIYDLGLRIGFGAGSPLFNIFHPMPVHVGPLTRDEALRLVCFAASSVGVSYEQEDADHVIALAGRIPYNLQVAGSLLYDAQRTGSRGASLHEAVRERFRAAMEQHFENHWRHLTEDELTILKEIAAGPKRLGRSSTVDALCDYGFVEAVGEDLRVLGGAFQDWIKECC